jgi:hypothetical protein
MQMAKVKEFFKELLIDLGMCFIFACVVAFGIMLIL